MSDGSTWKPNWRTVWIWSASISAVLSASMTFAIFADEPSYSALDRWMNYLIVGVAFWAMLTIMGVGAMLRVSYDPAAEAQRRQLREDESKNSPLARGTERALRFFAGLLRRK